MTDPTEKRVGLERFRGVTFVGGFSFADTLASATDWVAHINFKPELKSELPAFNNRPDTFSLGICNDGQLMSHLGWVGEGVGLEHNKSGRFESRFCAVKCAAGGADGGGNKAVSSTWLAGMEDAVLGLWVSHGERRFDFGSSGEREPEGALNGLSVSGT